MEIKLDLKFAWIPPWNGRPPLVLGLQIGYFLQVLNEQLANSFAYIRHPLVAENPLGKNQEMQGNSCKFSLASSSL